MRNDVANRKMHADEVHTDVPLARRLLAAPFPSTRIPDSRAPHDI